MPGLQDSVPTWGGALQPSVGSTMRGGDDYPGSSAVPQIGTVPQHPPSCHGNTLVAAKTRGG